MTNWFKGTLVKELNGSDFDDNDPSVLRDDYRCAFVLFYANWCGHCENLKPTYIKFADVAQFIHVYAVNVDDNQTLIQGINESDSVFESDGSAAEIDGFPTVWMYKDGLPWEECIDCKSVNAMVREARRLCDENCECSESQ